MNNIKYISLVEYEAMWKDLSSRMRFTSSGVCPAMKSMTVVGLSGEGTAFANEYDRLMYKNNNPDMPFEIRMVTGEGEVFYRVKKESR